MKAFLSYSSKDRQIVDQVAQRLGAGSSIYDRETFEEGKRSAEQIFRGLANSDVFVLFLSRNSISSDWVKSEIATALENVFSGKLKAVLVFALDDTSHQSLPKWLSSYTVERTDKPAQIARRIRSHLIELRLEQGDQSEIFIGRQKELRDLQRMFTLPPEEMKPVISASGWQGLGRRTFVRHAIQQVFPYLKRVHPSIALYSNDSIEDFHRKLFDAAVGMSRTSAEWRKAIEDFQRKSYSQRILQLLELVKQIALGKEILFIVGDGGLIQDNGDYVPYLRDLLGRITQASRPQLVLVHRRKMALGKQVSYRNIYFTSVSAFTDEESAELLGAHLKQRDVSFTRVDLDDLIRFVGGHPDNIRLAAEYARQYGLPQLRREKSDFVDIMVFKSLEIIKRIKMSALAKAICTALLDYQYLQIEDFVAALKATDAEIGDQLRSLEDHGVIERVGRYYRISPYLADAIVRSDFAQDYGAERKAVGTRLLVLLSETEEFDHVSLSLINAATLAAVKSGKPPESPILARYLLPSHLLTIAREEYDNSNHLSAIRLCSEALKNKERLTEDAQIEAYRLLSIALLRVGDRAAFQAALVELRKYHGKVPRRNEHFLRGFQARLDGSMDEAEKQFRMAYQFGGQNFSVLRELAHILALQYRYSEAEKYARAAYVIAPTNPFIIDVVCEVIIGKESAEDLRNNAELAKLLHELQALGTTQGNSFYNERTAHLMQKIGDHETAWRHINEAVRESPGRFGPRTARIHIGLQIRKFDKIDEDIAMLQSSMTSTDRNANRFLMDRARISYAIAKGELLQAKEQLERAFMLPAHVRRDLEADLRKAMKSTTGTETSPRRGKLRRARARRSRGLGT